MRLDELIGALGQSVRDRPPPQETAVEIGGLAYDSRAVKPADLFVCVGGFNSDGHDFAAQAVEAGAAALVLERPLALGVPEVLVDSARGAMAPLAAHFYGHPDRQLRVVGVTGTNGKTTTAYLVRALIEACGEQCGLLGTVKSVIGGREYPVARTTPEAIELQRDLRAMFDGGDRACASAEQIVFVAAIFTNLTQDHLDFHATMEDYFQAKRRLFLPATGAPPRVSVINVGDPYGRRLAEEVPDALTFALDEPADYSASGLRCELDRCSFTLRTPAGEREMSLALPGRFNVANALGALAAAHALGCDLDTLVAALERGVRVPGRFEPVDEGQGFAVLVDYAHTPDSLENVLRAAVELVADGDGADSGRVVCVFGAGGDRDRGKRPLMGAIAARLAELVFVTSDNPRSEDPREIIAEIMVGVNRVLGDEHGKTTFVRALADRREAIFQAVAQGRAGDVVVIAGKGHEQGQELADGHKLAFDDVEVAREALHARQASAAGVAER
jgi:UDP-N-acetylmuramoyl-L-alanyl-D-glutamate--2,6-diaminopimelate ligase